MRCLVFALGLVLHESLLAQGDSNPALTGAFENPAQHANNHATYVWGPGWDQYGYPPLGTKYRAMHMALIPPPSNLAGRVLVFDGDEVANPNGFQLWSIIKPEAPGTDPDKFWNFTLTVPRDPLEPNRNINLGCSGHTWLRDGRLLVVGGTDQLTPNLDGTRIVYIFDPASSPVGNGMWAHQFNAWMHHKRWYPSATWIDNGNTFLDRVLSTGGRVAASNPDDDSYEACSVPPSAAPVWQTWLNGTTPDRRFPGPSLDLGGIPGSYPLFFYPRIHLLTNAEAFRSGWQPDGAAITHVDGAARAMWTGKGKTSPLRIDGTSVLLPNIDMIYQDAVMILGGMDATAASLNSVEVCKATATAPGPFIDPNGTSTQGWDWTPLPSMQHKRRGANAVILPDATIMVFGGEDTGVTPAAGVLQAERFNGAVWQGLASASSYHGYHSTALLLPSGKVLVAGGEPINSPPRSYDYEVYAPPYSFGSSGSCVGNPLIA